MFTAKGLVKGWKIQSYRKHLNSPFLCCTLLPSHQLWHSHQAFYHLGCFQGLERNSYYCFFIYFQMRPNYLTKAILSLIKCCNLKQLFQYLNAEQKSEMINLYLPLSKELSSQIGFSLTSFLDKHIGLIALLNFIFFCNFISAKSGVFEN